MKLSELLVFRDGISATDVQKIEGYLAHKWGVTNKLTSGHPYTASAPTFADPIGAVDMTLFWEPTMAEPTPPFGKMKSILAVT